MYPITDEMKTLFVQKQRQTAEISVELKDGSTVDDFKITEADIVLGSFSIDRYSATGENIEIGSAVASEIKFTLDNSKGKFDGISLGGAKLFVRLGIKDWSDDEALMHYMDCGYFTVDENPKPLNYISVAALDNMMRFDRTVNWSNFSFPMSIEKIVSACCADCDVSLSSSVDFSALPNGTYIVQNKPTTTDITYRQLIQWVAEITGTCAFIDWNGRLRFKWSETTNVGLDTSNRYNSSVDESITITGVQITESETEFYLNGEEEVVFNIEGNELIQNNQTEVVANLGAVLNGFTYTPFECSCFPMPYLYPLDIISFTDIKGNTFNTMISAHVYTLNGTSSLKAVGESLQQKNYSVSNPFTKREALIIKNLKKEMETNMSRVEQETVDMNKVLANALGLYDTTVKHDDGSVTYYYHSKPTLEECSEGDLIFCLNAGGFGVCTTGWNDGDIVYTDGYNAVDGKAIFQYLVTKHLTADLITAGKLQSKDGNTYFDLENDEISTLTTDDEGNATTRTLLKDGTFTCADASNFQTTIDSAGLTSINVPIDMTSFPEKPDNWDKLGIIGKIPYFMRVLAQYRRGICLVSPCTAEAENVYLNHSNPRANQMVKLDNDFNALQTTEYTAEGITSDGKININKTEFDTNGAVFLPNSKSLYGYTTNGQVRSLSYLSEYNNTVIGIGGYNNGDGNTHIYGNHIIHYVKTANANYKPYYEAGDSFSTTIYTSGYVTTSATHVYFVIPVSKPIIGNPGVLVSSNEGFKLRQSGKYTHGSSSNGWVTPSSCSAWLLDSQTIQVRATFSDTTNVTNNDTIAVQWDGTITFS